MNQELTEETMNDELNANKKMSKEEFQSLCVRAEQLDVHRPNWCPDFHYGLYKICYLLVKEDSSCQGMSSMKRKKLIMKLMNTHIDHARQVIYDKVKAKKLADEAAAREKMLPVSDLKPQETTEAANAEQNA